MLAETVPASASAKQMSEFLQTSAITERRAFVKERMVIPCDALIRYTAPMPVTAL